MPQNGVKRLHSIDVEEEPPVEFGRVGIVELGDSVGIAKARGEGVLQEVSNAGLEVQTDVAGWIVHISLSHPSKNKMGATARWCIYIQDVNSGIVHLFRK